MIEVKRIVVGFLATNCYVVKNSSDKNVVLIDPGSDYDIIKKYLEEEKLVPIAVLLTHAHFDHCNAASLFQEDGCRVYLHRADEILVKTHMNMAQSMWEHFNSFEPDVLFDDGYEINECGMTFKCLYTPGHTIGGACFIIENIIFSGDTLFCLGIGRSDMPTGDGKVLVESIKNKLYALTGEFMVYPGHGDQTTLEFERKNNPYV